MLKMLNVGQNLRKLRNANRNRATDMASIPPVIRCHSDLLGTDSRELS